MSSSIRTRDGSYSVAASIIADEKAKGQCEVIDLLGVLEWAKNNGLTVPNSDKALELVNSARALSKLPRFVLKPSQSKSSVITSKAKRPVARSVAPIAKTESELLDLVTNYDGTRSGLVTAEVAEWLLSLNTGNRTVMPSNVARFKRMLQEGRWQNTGEPIIVSREGILNDGQHRLLAIKDTEIAAEADVRFGVLREAFKSTGTGKRRSPAQVLAIEGYSNTTCQSSIARLMIAYDKGQMGSFKQRGTEADEILALVDSDDRIGEVAARIQRMKFAPVRAGGFGFVLAVACRSIDPGTVFEFAELVASGLVPDDTNAARRLHLRLRDAAMRREQKDQLGLALITTKAWNAWFQNEPVQAFRVTDIERSSEKFPAIIGGAPACGTPQGTLSLAP